MTDSSMDQMNYTLDAFWYRKSSLKFTDRRTDISNYRVATKKSVKEEVEKDVIPGGVNIVMPYDQKNIIKK